MNERMNENTARHRGESGEAGAGTPGAKNATRDGDATYLDTLGPILLEQPSGDLIRALVLCHLLSYNEDVLIPLHLLVQRRVEGVTDGHRAGSTGTRRERGGPRRGCQRHTGRLSHRIFQYIALLGRVGRDRPVRWRAFSRKGDDAMR